MIHSYSNVNHLSIQASRIVHHIQYVYLSSEFPTKMTRPPHHISKRPSALVSSTCTVQDKPNSFIPRNKTKQEGVPNELLSCDYRKKKKCLEHSCVRKLPNPYKTSKYPDVFEVRNRVYAMRTFRHSLSASAELFVSLKCQDGNECRDFVGRFGTRFAH
jgi:hypothetical protein